MLFITLADVLREMDSGTHFDIEVVECDTKRGTGGALKAYSRVTKHISQPSRGLGKTAQPVVDTRNPNHFRNSTRNLYLPDIREVRKIHIRLITKFNGRSVL